MEVLRTISFYCEAKGLRFVVIGGHAVNAYGIARQTGDLDFLVERDRSADWRALLSKLQYTEYQQSRVFSRFKPSEIAAWPIDLMYVDTATFEKIYNDALDFNFGLVEVKIGSLQHLLALKIHALKAPQPHREAKDYGDVLALLRSNPGRVREDELEAICEKYGPADFFLRLKKDLEEGL